jgi:hypothetical protein
MLPSAPRLLPAVGYREVMPGKTPFDPTRPDPEAVRQIVIERLRHDKAWRQFDPTGSGFAPYVEYIGPNAQNGRHLLLFMAHEILWQMIVEGLLAPGMDPNNLHLPWFHITRHGHDVLVAGEPQPYDPTGYLARLRERVPLLDPTVTAYLAESLETFRKGNYVASTVMLGIAAERVFLLLCETLAGALSSAAEKTAFSKLLDRFPMNPSSTGYRASSSKFRSRRRPASPRI